MNQSEALEKIKKLLKHNGRTAAESDTAQIIAAALADKHGIDIAGIDAAEEQKRNEITHRQVGEWSSKPTEADYAALICQRFFEVSAITLNGWTETEVFVGTAWHLDIAEHVFRFLISEFRWQWNKKRGRCKKRKLFIYGCFVALSNKLHARFVRTTESMALEVSFKAKREAYMNELWPAATSSSITPKDRKGTSIQRGYVAGQDIEIRPGVKGGDQRGPAALPGVESRLLGFK